MADLRKAYREASIEGGSLPDVFIQAYDRIAALLHAAAASIEARDVEKKTAELNRALEIVFHLQGALNFEKGGDVAQTLSRFYSLIWREIMKGSAKLDAGTLRLAAAHVAEVRKVWEQSLAISAQSNPETVKASAPVPAPQFHSFIPRESTSTSWTA